MNNSNEVKQFFFAISTQGKQTSPLLLAKGHFVGYKANATTIITNQNTIRENSMRLSITNMTTITQVMQLLIVVQLLKVQVHSIEP